ncbi:hypothetical protein B0H67DRAFT_180879 [Lasiosphaeris hirsuta]|uniref:Uncharacterized protein n=1 Tax=Lasiosphaeris hirsuta TaxID=260670 RepID=A0AA40E2I4_9PEZI|nr:hypothetical protein B0H67DRAFT_180879 [Lasiosphaeris hirsuta]
MGDATVEGEKSTACGEALSCCDVICFSSHLALAPPPLATWDAVTETWLGAGRDGASGAGNGPLVTAGHVGPICMKTSGRFFVGLKVQFFSGRRGGQETDTWK